MNVHAKSCLTPEPLRTLRSETKGQAQPARTGRRPSPARCRDQSRGEESRAISVQLDRVTNGQSWAVRVTTKLAGQQGLQAIICPIPKLIVRVGSRAQGKPGCPDEGPHDDVQPPANRTALREEENRPGAA